MATSGRPLKLKPVGVIIREMGNAMTGGYGWNYTKRYFDRLLWLSNSGWAWEFRRRLPGLIGESRTTRLKLIRLLRDDGCELVRLRARSRRAERHGLHYLPAPNLSAYETPVFWLPEVMSTNLEAAATLDDRLRALPEPLSWQDIPGKKTLLIVPGRRTKLAIASRGYAAQLTINETSSPLPLSIYLTLHMQAGTRMLKNLQCLDWFARHCAGLNFDITPKRGCSPMKLRAALVALDGWRANASQRQIAEVLFGHDVIAKDWQTGVHSYKSRTRRLIKKGRDLMERDYLTLL